MDTVTGEYLQVLQHKVKFKQGNKEVAHGEKLLQELEELIFSETLDKEANKDTYIKIHTKY